jgi:hypothetical protein
LKNAFQIANFWAILAILAISCGPLPAFFSQTPHPAYLFCCKQKRNSHSTARSPHGRRPYFFVFSLTFASQNAGLRFAFSQCQAEGRKPHPGVDIFVENTRQSAIQQPYDSLVEALFLPQSDAQSG